MKHIKLKIFSLILALMLALFATGTAFAWFTIYSRDLDLGGASAGAYFAYGDGSVDNSPGVTGEDNGPFGITSQEHLYNLAWLQNTGRIDDGMYFELGADIKIDNGYVLPPIGNDKYPFNGVFNGNGHTISNLVVSTNKDVLYGNPADDDYRFSNAVGMFGMTGGESVITNFILDNPTVEVAGSDQNIFYNEDTEYAPVANAVTGLAIGYVAYKASSIGVIGGTLAVRRENYQTVNSIIGEISDEYKDNNNLTGGVGGSGSAFGASFDVESLVSRFNKIDANKNSSTPSIYLPNLDNGNNYLIPDNGEKVPFSVLPENEDGSGSTYVGANAKEIPTNTNVGYFIGNQNKIDYSKEITFGPKLVDPNEPSTDWYTEVDGEKLNPDESDHVPAWIYTIDTGYGLSSNVYTSQMGFAPLSQNEFDELPQSIRSIIPTDEELADAQQNKKQIKKKFLKIALSTKMWLEQDAEISTTHGTSLDDWSYHGQVSWMGKVYGKGIRDSEGNTLDENGIPITAPNAYNPSLNDKVKFSDYTEGIYLPNNAFWFKPARAGTARFLMFTSDKSQLRGFALLKVVRPSATRTEPFKAEFSTVDYNIKSDIIISQVYRVSVPRNVLFYFSYEITAEEIKEGNVEYYLIGDRGNGADFIYLDIGASAETGSTTEQADHEKYVTAIDFIYRGVTIATEDEAATLNVTAGSFVYDGIIYVETGVMLSFGGSGAIVCFYNRNEDEENYPLEAKIWVKNNDNYLKTKDDKEFVTQTGNNIEITKQGVNPVSG